MKAPKLGVTQANKEPIIYYYPVLNFSVMLSLALSLLTPSAEAAVSKRIGLGLGYSSLSLTSSETEVSAAFSGPAVVGDIEFFISKSFSMGFVLNYQQLQNAYTGGTLGGGENFSTGGGGFSVNNYLGKSNQGFIRNQFTFNQAILDQIDGAITKSHIYSATVWRLMVGYGFGSKSFKFSLGQSFEYHLLSGGEDRLNGNQEVGPLTGMGSSFFMTFSYGS